MKLEQLEQFKVWFDEFVSGFYGHDEYVNANISMKQKHSKCVCREMLYLADHLGLNTNQRLLAETIALFHDVGRFPQFIKYRTYSDVRSVNHSLLALDVLREKKVLENLAENEKSLIEKAVEYHSIMQLPADLNGDIILFSKMIRDADKLDIFRVVIEYYIQYRDNPSEFRLEMELPDEPGYSPALVDGILNEQRLDYRLLRNWNDMKLLQLSWVYDINFAATLKRIRENKYLETVIDFLPNTSDIEKVKTKVFEYVDVRINREN